MTTFDTRGKAFEGKFANDADLNFKISARRNRLLGEWIAAELLGLEGDEVASYAAEVVKVDLEEAGDDDVIRKVRADLDAAGVDYSDHRMEKQLAKFMVEAKQQLKNEV